MLRPAQIVLIALTVCGCGGSGSGSSGVGPARTSIPEIVNQSLGGIWRGARPNGTEITVLVSETGEFRVLDDFGNQGFGQAVVTNGSEVSIVYDLAPSFDRALIDGSDSGVCTLAGSVRARQSFDYEVTCTTSLGTEFGGEISLAYDGVYDRDSSIARIVGTYDNLGDALTIDANGVLFEQSVGTGCVINGNAAVIDPEWNLYEVTFVTESCGGLYAPLAGASWSGLATLLDEQGVAFVLGGFTAQVDGKAVSLILTLPKI